VGSCTGYPLLFATWRTPFISKFCKSFNPDDCTCDFGKPVSEFDKIFIEEKQPITYRAVHILSLEPTGVSGK